jgi:ligand-binding SRPBCC domain-containing protein
MASRYPEGFNMPRFEITTTLAAPPVLCFDAVRDIGLHVDSMSGTGERVIAGRSSGLIGLGEEVTFRGRHFGVLHSHTSRITIFDPPHHFRDSMIDGRFRRFDHDHCFKAIDIGTLMLDTVDYAVPLGFLGTLVDRLMINRHLQGLICERAATIKAAVEMGSRPNPVLRSGKGNTPQAL